MFLTSSEGIKSAGISPLDLINIRDILGCFYYLLSKGMNVCIMRLNHNYCVSSRVTAINEGLNKITLKTEDDVYFKKNENLKISFIINSIRYSFDSFVNLITKEGEFQFNLPASVTFDDKRSLPRIDFSGAVKNTLELTTGIFSGIKIKGRVTDISLGGLGFIPDQIDSVNKNKQIGLLETIIKQGDKYRSLKFAIEDSLLCIPGEIRHLPSDDDYTFGIKFHSLKGKCGKRLHDFFNNYTPSKKVINFSSFYSRLNQNNNE